jgi:ribosome-associated protein
MIFEFKGEYIELIKLLKATGLVMSGGEAKEAVARGLVIVDGEVETRKRRKIRRGMMIVFGDEVIQV